MLTSVTMGSYDVTMGSYDVTMGHTM